MKGLILLLLVVAVAAEETTPLGMPKDVTDLNELSNFVKDKLFSVVTPDGGGTTELYLDDGGLDLDGLQNFISDHPDPTDEKPEILADGGEVQKIVLANADLLKKNDDGSEDDSNLPDTFCFYTVCVNSCENSTLCWAPKRCHSDEDCENVQCDAKCGSDVLTSIQTLYSIIVDIPKQVEDIKKKQKQVKELKEKKKTTANPS